jgi:hypothetical protein
MAKFYKPKMFGALPVDLINDVLGTDLSPGNVRLSSQAHKHMAEDHPQDYSTCIKYLPFAIEDPTYIGQAPHHGRNFELVKRISRGNGDYVLVAIGLEPNKHGNYQVRSCYLIDERDIQARKSKKRLRLAHKKRPSKRPFLKA